MFTGIVQAVGTLSACTAKPGYTRMQIAAPEAFLAELQTGASIAVDGVCLTVVEFSRDQFCVDAVEGTLRITRLGECRAGIRVNLERALRVGDEVGGHFVSGHVAGTAELLALPEAAEAGPMRLRLPAAWRAYVFAKGYLAVNGISLTVAEVERDSGECLINLIPETLTRTTLRDYRPGDVLNIEVDAQTVAVVDTVAHVLEERGL